ncbi:MAG TPA: tetratricopeptide repeat protein, partial [Bacteroidia bacterium]|nr:tetratricopeptide repeat protein [Bacteroidia bacterium]
MKYKIISKILFAALFLIAFTCKSQQSKIDSLQNVLKKNIADTERVNTYNHLGSAFQHIGKNTESLNCYDKALVLAQQSNFVFGEVMSYILMGYTYDTMGKYQVAIAKDEEGLKIALANNLTERIAAFYGNIGTINMELGNGAEGIKNYQLSIKYAESIGNVRIQILCSSNIGGAYFEEANYILSEKYFLKSKLLAEKIGDKKGIATSYYTLGAIYNIQNDYKAALVSMQKALEIQKSINENQDMIGTYINIGVVYHELGKDSDAIKNYDSALILATKFGDKRDISDCNFHMGELYEGEKQYEKALTKINISSTICEEIGNKSGLASVYNAEASLYFKMNKIKEAINYYSKGQILAIKINKQLSLQDAYNGLADSYYELKDYKKAYDYFKLYSTLKDTLLNQANNKQLTQMNLAYESDKKDKEIELLNKDSELRTADLTHQKTITRVAEIGLTLLVIFSLLLYSRFRLTRKQKDIIELQKKIVDEKNKDITDSIHYAYRIQQALLVSENYLKKQLSEYFILYQPKDIVSGDFYWASHTESKFLIAAGDSTGHGVPGAFMSMLGINFLNEIVIEKKEIEPDKILNELRKNIINALNPADAKEESQDGVDMILCSFDFNKKVLQFSASNRPLWIVRKSSDNSSDKPQILEFKPDKFPVGKHSNDTKPFTLQTVQLQKDDIVYAFSDGYVDQFGGKDGKKFKYKQLQEILIANYHKPLSEQKEMLSQLFQNWKGNL